MRYGWLLFAVACDDHVFPAANEGGGAWCEILDASCGSCHNASLAQGGLDLQSDPRAALVDVPSSAGDIYVVPGDPDASYLIERLESDTAPMPPTGGLPAESIDIIRQWIADGASDDCESGGGGDGVHPSSWPDPLEHGIGAKLGELACATSGCHGADLSGDAGPACSSCHDEVVSSWESSCTFCHGDRATGQPAPPEDVDDREPGDISFPGHLAHVEGTALHAPMPCTECHSEPTDIFSPGHLPFGGDETPGVAEITFAGSEISTFGGYEDRTCTVYCHGPSLAGGGEVSAEGEIDCGDCHSVPPTQGGSLSDPHDKHLEEGVICAECHPTVNNAGSAVLEPAQHVDGDVDLELPGGMTLDGDRCTGACHGETHNSRLWAD